MSSTEPAPALGLFEGLGPASGFRKFAFGLVLGFIAEGTLPLVD